MADEQRTRHQRLQIILDEEPFDFGVKLRVVGVGDAAGNVIEHLQRSPIKDAELILIDADLPLPPESNLTIATDHEKFGFQSPPNYRSAHD